MAQYRPDERAVYQALKNVFEGNNAQMRNKKEVRKLIRKKKTSNRDIDNLVRGHGINNVSKVAADLLGQYVFQSTISAKNRFPELFEVSPAQSAERKETEAAASRHEALHLLEDHKGDENPESRWKKIEAPPSTQEESSPQPRRRCFPDATIAVPELYPAYLPYTAQHSLLVQVQALLEISCYRFAKEKMSYEVRSKGWDCPEAAELTVWLKLLLSSPDKLSTSKVAELGKPLEVLFDSVAQLRHAAVYRLRVKLNRIEQLMVDSELLATLLEDDTYARTMSKLRQQTQLTIDEWRCKKDLLESNLSEALKKIASQRAELDRLEREAVDDMVKGDEEHRSLAGANIENAIVMLDRAAAQSDEPADTETAYWTDSD